MTMAINATESNIFTNYHPTKMEKEPKKEKATITLQEWWNGEKSVTSTMARRVGWENLADWLEDKDKVCTDGQDDGKLGFKEGAKSFAKGLVGGIPKAIIQHPLITGVFIGVGAAAIGLSGGAAAPLVWGIGATLVAGSAVTQGYKAITADTDAEKKAALEGLGTATQSAILVGTTYKPTMQAAAKAGVDTSGNIAQTMKSAAEISGRNAKANIAYMKDGVVTQHATMAHKGIQTSYQGDGKPVDMAYKVNIDPKASVEQNLANNPGLSYEASTGKYYVKTSWGEPRYVDPNASKGYMYVKYGEYVDDAGNLVIDHNAVEGIEFSETYVDYTKFAADGTKSYIDAGKLNPGQQVVTTKQAPGMFKVAPEGTQYISAEGPGTLQPKSVLRFDGQGRPYESTVDFMFKKFQNLTPEQIAMLKSVDPEAAVKYGY